MAAKCTWRKQSSLQFIVTTQRAENVVYVGQLAPNASQANQISQNPPLAVQCYCEHQVPLPTKKKVYVLMYIVMYILMYVVLYVLMYV